MYPFQRILRALRAWLRPKRSFDLDVNALETLRTIAEIERSTPQAIAGQLLEDALRRQELRLSGMSLWQSLTPREQEVTALLCLQYTNREIASRLHISPETVKTHVAHILIKLGLPNRAVLRDILSGLDFSQWEE
jgi:DNA-binding CsgD family transcriptional regulator